MDFDSAFDRTTWQVLTAVLTAVGLLATVLLWRSRGPVAGLRAFAVTLLPAAAYLTGAIRMLWEIGDAVVSFAVRLTFSPLVWAGVGLASLAVVLWVVAGFLRGRGIGGRPAVAETGSPDRVEPARPRRKAVEPTAPAEDEDDIEAILRRHGIQ